MRSGPAGVARLQVVCVALAQIIGVLAAGAGLAWIGLRLLPLAGTPAARFAGRAAILAGAFLVATLAATRLGGLTWQDVGWRPSGRRTTWFALGAATGLGLAAIALAVVVPSSGVRLSVGGTRVSASLAPLLVALSAAALFEELIFRGAPLVLLARAVGRWPATLVAAVGFGLAHGRNPNATWFSTVNIALAAVLLSVAFWSRGGMPLAWGLHFGWNAALGLLFGAPVSGIAFGVAPLGYAAGLRPWVDGGAFGPEGGLAGTVAFAAGVAVLVRRRLAQPGTWLA
jgi:membrane protease YdiL (CAAX protease family)